MNKKNKKYKFNPLVTKNQTYLSQMVFRALVIDDKIKI